MGNGSGDPFCPAVVSADPDVIVKPDTGRHVLTTVGDLLAGYRPHLCPVSIT